MYQQALFEYEHLASVVNVATVPQRSPFRYPGGKTWLVPRLRRWLSPVVRAQFGLTPERPKEFIEPFAGGGIIGLTVAFERLADHVTMVELDADVAAVWQTILDGDSAEWLAQAILAFDMTHDAVVATLAQAPGSLHERAFQTILRNRVCHGGIMAPGSGLIKQGENGRGLRSRWYPVTLARRIRAIAAIRERITFIAGDGLELLAAHAHNPEAVFFIDPPYTVPGKGKRAGSRLYTHANLDHARLFDEASQLAGDFLMTYDAASEVIALAQRRGFAGRLIPMKNTHHARMSELLIARNLDWVAQSPAADASA
ncbi:MAG: DNA adenine methylase [Chloroflexota bacterium]|nr:DNA adenine methylase [Chloroflexota bacterium]